MAGATDGFAFENSTRTIQDANYPNFDSWLNGISDDRPGIERITFDVEIGNFRCPSDTVQPTNTIIVGPSVIRTNGASLGIFFVPPTTNTYSTTNYVANAGAIAVPRDPHAEIVAAGFVGFHGPIRSREAERIESIADGSSNVLLFGESLGHIDTTGWSNFDVEFPDNIRNSLSMGGIAIGRGDLYGSPNLFGNLFESSFVQFGSPHPTTINFFVADGSTRSMNRQMSSELMGRWCGVSDGQSVTSEF